MSLLHDERECSVVDGLLRGMLDLGTFTYASPDGPGRVRQILAIEFVEFGSCPRREGREHVRGVELGTRVGPDRIT